MEQVFLEARKKGQARSVAVMKRYLAVNLKGK